jgi:uncharacterized SAM-binding protein YcdF (DUF218 family)
MILAISWLILLTGVILYLLKVKRTGLVCVFCSIAWFGLISFPFFPDLLTRSLENQFPTLLKTSQLNSKDSINIMVLGGGETSNRNLPANDQLWPNSLCRIWEGIRIHNLLKNSNLVLQGSFAAAKFSGSETYLQAAIAMGVGKNEICLLGYPNNTQMEAFEYTKKFGTNKTLVLVTDAIHMPRAMFFFRKAGQNPIPAPTNHLIKTDRKIRLSDWGPSAFNIYKMENAMHEIFGIVWAKITVKRKK